MVRVVGVNVGVGVGTAVGAGFGCRSGVGVGEIVVAGRGVVVGVFVGIGVGAGAGACVCVNEDVCVVSGLVAGVVSLLVGKACSGRVVGFGSDGGAPLRELRAIGRLVAGRVSMLGRLSSIIFSGLVLARESWSVWGVVLGSRSGSVTTSVVLLVCL